jgi:hypothetical protein
MIRYVGFRTEERKRLKREIQKEREKNREK